MTGQIKNTRTETLPSALPRDRYHRRAEDDKEPLPGRLDQECSRAVMPGMRQFPACIRQQVHERTK